MTSITLLDGGMGQELMVPGSPILDQTSSGVADSWADTVTVCMLLPPDLVVDVAFVVLDRLCRVEEPPSDGLAGHALSDDHAGFARLAAPDEVPHPEELLVFVVQRRSI